MAIFVPKVHFLIMCYLISHLKLLYFKLQRHPNKCVLTNANKYTLTIF